MVSGMAAARGPVNGSAVLRYASPLRVTGPLAAARSRLRPDGCPASTPLVSPPVRPTPTPARRLLCSCRGIAKGSLLGTGGCSSACRPPRCGWGRPSSGRFRPGPQAVRTGDRLK